VKWINKFLNYILFFTVAISVGVFGYIYYSQKEKKRIEQEKKIASQQPSAEELVNKYLKQGSVELQQQQIESMAKIKSNLIDEKKNKVVVKEIPPDQIPIEMQIAKDKSNSSEQSLTEEFNQKYFQSQVDQVADEQARKEYAKEFIENARKNGYHITLSEDLQVTSVKPIRKPTNQQNDDSDVFESQPSH
jgi:hypothetical protein